MKNLIKKSWSRIAPDEATQQAILQNILAPKKNKLRGFDFMSKRVSYIATIAAVMAICLFGSSMLGILNNSPEVAGHRFEMVAYAADGEEIASTGALTLTVGEFELTAEDLARFEQMEKEAIEIKLVGDVDKIKDLEQKRSDGITMTQHCLDDNGNIISIPSFKLFRHNEAYDVTVTAYFTDGTSETQTLTIPPME